MTALEDRPRRATWRSAARWATSSHAPSKLLAQFLAWLHERRRARRSRSRRRCAWATLPSRGSASLAAAPAVASVRGFAALPARPRPGRRGPAADAAARRAHRAVPLPLHRRRDRRADGGRTGVACPRRAARDDGDADRAAGGHRDADRRGDRARPRRHRPRSTAAADPSTRKFGKSREVRCHPTTIAALRAYLRAATSRVPASRPALRVRLTLPATRLTLLSNVHRSFERIRRARRCHPRSAPCRPQAARPAPHLRGQHPAGLVSRTARTSPARLPLLSTYLGHVDPGSTYWYLQAAPELLALAPQRLERHLDRAGRAMSALAPTLQAFFTDRLIGQRHASPHTIAAYRDTLRLLLAFAAAAHRQAAQRRSTSTTSTRR